MDIDFCTNPDETGKGRVIVDGRFYGLPMGAVLEFQRLQAHEKARNEACAKIAEEFEDDMGYGNAQKIADAIRALPC